jgi:hydroxymethylbilane synthase
MPIGAYADIEGDRMRLNAIVISLDGARAVRADAEGGVAGAESLGEAVADQLLAEGASDILDAVQQAHAAVEGLQP